MKMNQHEVFVESAGDNRVGVMAVLRRRLGISPIDAKRLLDVPAAPIGVGSALQVTDWVDELRGLGARVVVRPELPHTPLWMRPAPRERPRAHHYELAHVAFVSFFRENDAGFWSLFTQGGDPWVRSLWRRIGEALPPEERVEDTGLSLAIGKLRHLELAVVTLPAPLAHAEAYFVALVRYPPQQAASSGRFRYMTLERGLDVSTGGSQTYLCEWTGTNHLNHGTGPAPTVEGFVQAIAALLEER